jgi:hypothetical protein
MHYNVNGNQYDMGYYLADKIYSEWATFVKTVSAPQSLEDKLFSQRQGSMRKDVEKAFGVLQARFDIVHRQARLWKQADVINIMQTCVILHNMIVEDEKETIMDILDLNEDPSAMIVIPPKVHINDIPEHFEPGPLARPAPSLPTKLTGRAWAEILKPAKKMWPEPGPKCCFNCFTL